MAKQIVFIDSRVQNFDPSKLVLNSADYEIVYINGSSSGLGQVADYLSAKSEISAIHIISHGSSGSPLFGSNLYTSST